jgi:hypothetical protein
LTAALRRMRRTHTRLCKTEPVVRHSRPAWLRQKESELAKINVVTFTVHGETSVVYMTSRVIGDDISCLERALSSNGCNNSCGSESKCCQDIRDWIKKWEEFKKMHPFDPKMSEVTCPTSAEWKAATGLVIPAVSPGPAPTSCTPRPIIKY